MIVVLDNRDSFVFNLARHFHLLGAAAAVVPSHAIDVEGLFRLEPQAVVISPGPCTPAEAGCSVDAIRGCRGRPVWMSRRFCCFLLGRGLCGQLNVLPRKKARSSQCSEKTTVDAHKYKEEPLVAFRRRGMHARLRSV